MAELSGCDTDFVAPWNRNCLLSKQNLITPVLDYKSHEGKNFVGLAHLYLQSPNIAWPKLSNPSINVGSPLCLVPTGPYRSLLVAHQSWIPASCLQTGGSCHLPSPLSPASLLCISNRWSWKLIWSQPTIPHHKASSGLWPSESCFIIDRYVANSFFKTMKAFLFKISFFYHSASWQHNYLGLFLS